MPIVKRHRIHRKMDEDQSIGEWFTNIVLAWQAESARTLQKGLGPSEVGQCPEYIRAWVSGDEREPEVGLKNAANVGTAIGDMLESIFGERVEAITQRRLRAKLPRTGFEVEGNSDIIVPRHDVIIDVKSKAEFATVKREGASFQNLVQLSIYFLAAVEAGLITKGGLAILVYADRSGREKNYLACSWDYNEALRYIAMAEENLVEVMRVLAKQKELEASGREPLEIRELTEPDRAGLRDEKPSTCYAIQCPFRSACWGTSELMPLGTIDDENAIQAAHNYADFRDLKKESELGMVSANKELALLGAKGVTQDGKLVVAWVNTGKKDDQDEPITRIDVRRR